MSLVFPSWFLWASAARERLEHALTLTHSSPTMYRDGPPEPRLGSGAPGRPTWAHDSADQSPETTAIKEAARDLQRLASPPVTPPPSITTAQTAALAILILHFGKSERREGDKNIDELQPCMGRRTSSHWLAHSWPPGLRKHWLTAAPNNSEIQGWQLFHNNEMKLMLKRTTQST